MRCRRSYTEVSNLTVLCVVGVVTAINAAIAYFFHFNPIAPPGATNDPARGPRPVGRSDARASCI